MLFAVPRYLLVPVVPRYFLVLGGVVDLYFLLRVAVLESVVKFLRECSAVVHLMRGSSGLLLHLLI